MYDSIISVPLKLTVDFTYTFTVIVKILLNLCYKNIVSAVISIALVFKNLTLMKKKATIKNCIF